MNSKEGGTSSDSRRIIWLGHTPSLTTGCPVVPSKAQWDCRSMTSGKLSDRYTPRHGLRTCTRLDRRVGAFSSPYIKNRRLCRRYAFYKLGSSFFHYLPDLSVGGSPPGTPSRPDFCAGSPELRRPVPSTRRAPRAQRPLVRRFGQDQFGAVCRNAPASDRKQWMKLDDHTW